GSGFPAWRPHINDHWIRSWRFFKIDAKKGAPKVASCGLRFGLRVCSLPECYISAVPFARQVGHRHAASDFEQKQAALAGLGGAQFQSHSRNARCRDFRASQSGKGKQSEENAQPKAESFSNAMPGAQAQAPRCWRSMATRGSTFSNCARPILDPRMAASISRNRSGFFVFSRTSFRKGRIFAKMKYASPQKAGSKNSFSLTMPFSTKASEIPQERAAWRSQLLCSDGRYRARCVDASRLAARDVYRR